MKKIFYGIGALLAIFSILQFMLCADMKLTQVEDSTEYEFILDSYISPEDIEEIAVKNDVMIVNREIVSGIFAKRKINFYIFNHNNIVKEGKQENIFPNSDIEYIFVDKYSTKKYQDISVFTNDETKANNVRKDLDNKNYTYRAKKLNDIRLGVSCLFCGSSLRFFILIGILSVLSIVSYYIYRLKEIGILRLNGWSSFQISWKIMKVMLSSTAITCGILMTIAGIYITIMDVGMLPEYLEVCIIVSLFQLLIYGISELIAAYMIKGVNRVSAVKNSKNNKLMFRMLILAKVITIGVLFFDINGTVDKLIYNKDINDTMEIVSKSDLYVIGAHVPLEEKVSAIIKQEMLNISDTDVYESNSFDPEDLYSGVEIKKMLKKAPVEDLENIFRVTDGMVNRMDIKDENGNYIRNIDVGEDECVLLVPKHYEHNIEKIKAKYEDYGSNLKIIFIQDSQYYISYQCIGSYHFDPIIKVINLDKRATSGIMLSRKGKEQFEAILEKYGIENDILSVESLEDTSKEFKVNNEVEMFQNIIFLIISIISYIMVAITIIIIYFEFRKKQFGVYTLLGKYPVAEIIYLAAINIIIVTGAALIINKSLLVVILVEMALYAYMVYNYLNKKAILAIKGE